MKNHRLTILVGMLATLAIWGCSQGPTPDGGGAAKTGRLQDELRTLTTLRDQLQKDLKGAVSDRERLQQEVEELRLVVKERDDLRQQLAGRTAERDAMVGQVDQLRKGIRALLEQADAAMPTNQPIGKRPEPRPIMTSAQ